MEWIRHNPIQGDGFDVGVKTVRGWVAVKNRYEKNNVLCLKPEDAIKLARDLLVAAVPQGED